MLTQPYQPIGTVGIISALTWLDLLIIVFMVIMTVWGLWSGLLWQAYRIMSLVLGVAIAARLGLPLSTQLGPELIPSDMARRFLCYIIIFLLVVVSCYFIGRMTQEFIDRIKLGPMDRFLGALFGCLKGTVVCGALLIGILSSSTQDSLLVQEIYKSGVSVAVVRVCGGLWGVLPPEVKMRIRYRLAKAAERSEEEEEPGKDATSRTAAGPDVSAGKEDTATALSPEEGSTKTPVPTGGAEKTRLRLETNTAPVPATDDAE